MDYTTLRKTYHKFVYRSYETNRVGEDLHFSFRFSVPPDIEFRPSVVVKDVPAERSSANLAFHLGLAEIPSYWKATCSPEIVIEAGALNGEQLAWWKDLLIQGMGQYFFENQMDFTAPDFLTITSAPDRPRLSLVSTRLSLGERGLGERMLVPVGGGKDAAVTLELLQEAGVELRPLLLNPKPEQLRVLKAAGAEGPLVVERAIDPRLLELNRQGYLNGHTPFSAYLAFLSALCAVLFDYKYVALSNERSSNEGNVEYLGREINHQYSKTFEFEKKFREYSKKHLAKDLEYFSFLRPLYELQIARIFARHPKYFSAFLSCNEARKTGSGKKQGSGEWCGACPKCLFVFAALYPFVDEQELAGVFGKNLFLDDSLIPLMEELTGERGIKPFECVGTKEESLAAFFLGLKKHAGELPALLRHFRERILPKHPDMKSTAERILHAWNLNHALPPRFEEFLKAEIDKRSRAA